MNDRHAAALAWAQARGVAGAVEAYAPAGGRAAASAAGRRAATRALAAADLAPLDAGARHADGRPCWPAGATGSITHRAGVALALAAPLSQVLAVGVDRELRAALPLVDATLVLDDDEQSWAAAQHDPDDAATALWSAKEAAFKAWNEAAGGVLPPVDPRRHVHVDIRPDATVRVEPRHELAAAAAGPVEGCVWRDQKALVVVVVVVVAATDAINPPGAAGP